MTNEKTEPTKELSIQQSNRTEIDTFFDKGRLSQMLTIANEFVKAGCFGRDVQNAHQAFVKIQAGFEIGMPPMEAMQSFYIVNGKTTMWGKAVTKRLREAGWQIEYIESTKEKAVVKITKGGETYTETAEKSDVKQDGAYKIAPKNKLRYHALAMLVNFYVPEVLGGSVQYITEDIQHEKMVEGSIEGSLVVDDKRPDGDDDSSGESATEIIPEVAELLRQIVSCQTIESVKEIQEIKLPRWIDSYSDEDLNVISESITQKLASFKPKPAAKKIDGKPENTEAKKPDLKVEKIGAEAEQEVVAQPKEDSAPEKKPSKSKPSLVEDAEKLFDSEKVSAEIAERFEKFIEASGINAAKKFKEYGVTCCADLTIEQAKEFKLWLQKEYEELNK